MAVFLCKFSKAADCAYTIGGISSYLPATARTVTVPQSLIPQQQPGKLLPSFRGLGSVMDHWLHCREEVQGEPL